MIGLDPFVGHPLGMEELYIFPEHMPAQISIKWNAVNREDGRKTIGVQPEVSTSKNGWHLFWGSPDEVKKTQHWCLNISTILKLKRGDISKEAWDWRANEVET